MTLPTKTSLYTLLLLLASVFCVSAQITETNSSYNTIRAITQNSAAMSLYQRYGDIPVNFNTGVPNIAVPLGELKLKNFSWPVSISYHAGGIRVADVASTVGLGWVLNAGGFLTTKGHQGWTGDTVAREYDTNFNSLPYFGSSDPDEPEAYYSNWFDVTQAENYRIFSNYTVNNLFYLNTPVVNSKFLFHDNVGYPIPLSNIKLVLENHSGTYVWVVTDTQGNRYIFGKTGSTANLSVSEPSVNYIHALTRIETYAGDTLRFSYNTLSYGYSNPNSETRQTLASTDCARCLSEAPLTPRNDPNGYLADDFQITEITTSSGQRVTFHYGERDDLTDSKKMESVLFQEKVGGLYLTKAFYEFNYDYFGSSGSSNLRLKLLDVTNTLHTNNQEVYAFEYDSGVLPSRLSKAVDYSGYYNGETGNTTLIPSQSDRDFSLTHTKSSVLNKITYPTGGYTTFNYELNTGDWGGLRIESMTDYTASSVTAKKRSYTYSGGSTQLLNFTNTDNTYFFGHYPNGWVTSAPTSALELFTCTVYTEQSSPVVDFIGNFLANSLSYAQVTELVDDFSTSTVGAGGKTVYRYDSHLDLAGRTNTYPIGPLLTEKEVYKRDGSGYTLLHSENDYYHISDDYNIANPVYFWAGPKHPRERSYWEKKVELVRPYMKHDVSPTATPYYRHYPRVYLERNRRLDAPVLFHDKKVVKDYDGSKVLTVETLNTYPSYTSEIEPYEITATGSDGLQVKQELKYTTSSLSGLGYTSGELSANATALADNLIRPVWTQSSKNSMVNGVNQVYFGTVNSKAFPVKEKLGFGGSSSKTMEVSKYDASNNATELLNNGLSYSAYRFSVKNELTAEFSNAPFDETAYSSFDNGGATGLSFSSGSISTTYAYSGKASFNLSSSSLTKANLVSGKTYVLTAYGKSGSFSIGSATTLSTQSSSIAGGWTLYTLRFVPSGTSVTVSGTGYIDDVAVLPASAGMKAYVYGDYFNQAVMSFDTKNIATFFEYYQDGRLYRTRDQAGNLLNQYCYNYAGQTVDCTTAYTAPGFGPQVVYARLELSNITEVETGAPGDAGNVDTHADVYIRFYTNSDCTTAHTLPATQTVTLGVQNNSYYNSSTYNNYSTNNYNGTSGYSEISLGNLVVKSILTEPAPFSTFNVSGFELRMLVVPYSGGGYKPATTIGDTY